MSYNDKDIKLNNGRYIPSIGFGTSLVTGNDCIEIINKAIEVGYRHIDTASVYNNEIEIGQAINSSNINRKELFITSKVWKNSMGYENTIKSFNNTLKNLKLEYVDLFLIHWPKNNDVKLNVETWKALEKIYAEGRAKSIGVSNFLKNHLEIISPNCRTPVISLFLIHNLISSDYDLRTTLC